MELIKEFVCFFQYLSYLNLNLFFWIFITGNNYLDFFIEILYNKSFLSAHFIFFETLEKFYIGYFYTPLILFLIWIAIDLSFYFLWKYFSRCIKFKFNQKKLFYIFFRFIPIIWWFWVLIWALFSKEFTYKKDFLKILVWNLVFVMFNIAFWLTAWNICWIITERNFS